MSWFDTMEGYEATVALLDELGRHESNGNYEAYHNNARNKSLKFTEMTIDEVLKWQRNREWRKLGGLSSAVGKYQIIQMTLEDLVEWLMLTGKEKFNETMQDKMALRLLEKRGWKKYKEGKLTQTQMLFNISKEWASWPNPHTGSSYYDKDGINKSSVSVEKALSFIPLAPEKEKSWLSRLLC